MLPSTRIAQKAPKTHGKCVNIYRYPFKVFANDSLTKASTVAIATLLSFRHQHASMLRCIFAVSLFSAHANRSIFQMFGRIGLSLAYSTLNKKLHQLADSARAHIIEIGKLAVSDTQYFAILYDNINKFMRAWHQMLGNWNTMQNGTAATIIVLDDVPPGAFDAAAYHAQRAKKLRAGLTLTVLKEDVDADHLENMAVGLLIRTWAKYIPSLRRHAKVINELFRTDWAKHRMREGRRTETVPLRTTDINKATTGGTGDVLRNVASDQLQIPEPWFDDHLVLVCGDLLSVELVRSLKKFTEKDLIAFSQFLWAIPIPQLWHMKWAFLRAIYRVHWSIEHSGKGIFGFRHEMGKLNRTGLNPDKCDFYPCHNALQVRFEALSLAALRLVFLASLKPKRT